MKANVEWVHCVISVRRSGMRATSEQRANEFCGYYGVYLTPALLADRARAFSYPPAPVPQPNPGGDVECSPIEQELSGLIIGPTDAATAQEIVR